MFNKKLIAMSVAATMVSMAAQAQDAEQKLQDDEEIEEVVATSAGITYANNVATEGMVKQQSDMTSVLAIVDNIPGVMINEGDAFGGDDWSTTISIRGFQVNLDEQQIGMTVDGMPNGNSNYGGGAKANRYIDTLNIGGVDVSQGTADISSRSHEALGGTIDFKTDDPVDYERLRVNTSRGDNNAEKHFIRYDTGEIFNNTFAWVSLSSSNVDAWIDESGEANRDHLAAKFISNVNGVDLTGYLSIDDTHEDNYQRVSLAQFEADAEWDRLTGDWTGVPYIDQSYRRGWSTVRKNTFGYLKAAMDLSDDFSLKTGIYLHKNSGHGDWVPPYIQDVTDDGAEGHSEIQSNPNTVKGGDTNGRIYFVDANGNSLQPIDGCESSLTFPYGGGGAVYDPACYADGAIPVGSFRHTHYHKQRLGLTADIEWVQYFGDVENVVTAGVWYEQVNREERRDWHKIIDSRSSYHFDDKPYWEQYSLEFPTTSIKYYLQDEFTVGDLTANVGVKQFLVDIDRKDHHQGGKTTDSLNSDSDLLWSAGVVYQLPAEGMEVFAGFAQNFAAIKDSTMEQGDDFKGLDPENADNFDLGLRYFGDNTDLSLALYHIEFDNRLYFLSADNPVDGVDFDGADGIWMNGGGIESQGLELSVTSELNDNLKFYAAYSYNESEYVGTGNAGEDAALKKDAGIESGNEVAGTPEEMLVLSLDGTRGKYLGGVSSKWISERWMDAANTTRVPDYIVTDLYAGVKMETGSEFIQGLDIRMTVNNLFNERYIGGITGGAGWLGAPRTAALSMTADF